MVIKCICRIYGIIFTKYIDSRHGRPCAAVAINHAVESVVATYHVDVAEKYIIRVVLCSIIRMVHVIQITEHKSLFCTK